MTTYTIVLERTLNGSACGTTHDVIEAPSEWEAVEIARREWKRIEPRFAFRAFFSAPTLASDSTEPSNANGRVVAA
jgi:hypothetical protein